VATMLGHGVRNHGARVLAQFEARLASDVAEDGVASMAAAVAVNGTVIWQGAFGWANTAQIQFAPAKGVGVVLLRNYQSGRTNLARTAHDLVVAVVEASRAPVAR